MGDEVIRGSLSTRLCWWLVEITSQVLEPGEREVVLGDLAETGACGSEALRGVLSLVVRRQAALWLDWRPWLAVVGIAVPLGTVFSLAARSWADGIAIYAFLYVDRFDWLYLQNPGSRHHMTALAAGFLLNCAALVAWSSTAGFVLGRLSRRAVWVTAGGFGILVLAASVGSETTARINGHNSDVFSLPFYGVILPRLMRVGAVLVPALWGIRRGLRSQPLRLGPALVGAAVVVLLTAWSARGVENALTFGRGLIPAHPGPDGFVGTFDDPRPWFLLPLFVLWPTLFIVATTLWRQLRERRGILVVVAIAAFGTSVNAQRSPDYPQWRGLDRDGAASGFVVPKTWPKQLTRRWRVAVGEGYGTPIVVGDAVYVFTRREGQEVLTALDASTGKERWHSSYPAPYSPSQPTAAHGSGPKATPLFRDGKIFTLGISGIMSAFDATTGKVLWQTREPPEHPFFSAASSPAGEANLVFAHPGNYGPLTAFDPISGTVKWTAGEGGFFMSPLIATLEGTRQVITVTQGGVIGVSVPEGRLLWTYAWPGGRNGGSMPVLHGETVIVASGEGMLAVKPSMRGGQWVVEKVWESQAVSLYLSNPVVIGHAIYGLSTRDKGRFFALDATDGTVLWLGEPREATNTAIVKAAGLLLLLNDDGELIVAKASRTGFDAVARYTVSDSATWAQPAISGNRIFIKDVDSLSLWRLE